MTPEMQFLEEEAECSPDYAEERPEEWKTVTCEVRHFERLGRGGRQREPARRQDAIDVLGLKLQVNALRKQVDTLTRRIKELSGPLIVPINTFAPKPFEPLRPILVAVEAVASEADEDPEYVATFSDGGLSMTGDTLEEALSLLKDRMAGQYSKLSQRPPEQLGRIPSRQLAALKAVMRRIE